MKLMYLALSCLMMIFGSCACKYTGNSGPPSVYKTRSDRMLVFRGDKIYINPIMKNNAVDPHEFGKDIIKIKPSVRNGSCYDLGGIAVIARFEGSEALCGFWKFNKRNTVIGDEYTARCDPSRKCMDNVFLSRPFVRYVLSNKSELILIQFDPESPDSEEYTLSSVGKFSVY